VAGDIIDLAGVRQGYLLAPLATGVGNADELVSLGEAAGLLGISRAAVHQALSEGRLQGERVGNAWAIRRRFVDAYQPRPRKRTGVGEPALAPC